MEQKNHVEFAAAKKALDDAFKERFDGKMFLRNWGWALAGVALFLAALWLTAAAVVAATGVLDLRIVLLALGAIVVTVLLLLLVQEMRSSGKCLVIIAIMISGGVAAVVGFPVIAAAFASGWLAPLVLPLLGLPLVLSAFFWIAAPTREGRAVLDRIAGFRAISVDYRRRTARPHDATQGHTRAVREISALRDRARGREPLGGPVPVGAGPAAAQGRPGFAWYAGSSSPWSDTSGFVGAVGSSLASTVSSASTAPGSSSGSGGGGSSGGGGGGGGGGGW